MNGFFEKTYGVNHPNVGYALNNFAGLYEAQGRRADADAVHDHIAASLTLKQVLVENSDGVQYCDAFGRDVSYSLLSGTLGVPGQTETLEVVRLGDLNAPLGHVLQGLPLAAARVVAKTIAERNLVAGQGLKLRDNQVVFGKSSQNADGTWSFV